MKVELSREEVRGVLTTYCTHNLHIPANVVDIQADGSVVLSYVPPLAQEAGPWTRLWHWATGRQHTEASRA